MPPIYYLNPPPNPFWDFVAGLEDHPFFRGPPPPPRHGGFRSGPPPPAQPTSTSDAAAEAPPQSQMSEKAQGKQPYVEDPPEVDPSTVKPEPKKAEEPSRERAFPFRGRGRFAGAFGEDDNNDNNGPGCGKGREDREAARRCRRAGRHGPGAGPDSGPGPHGPPPFMMGHPFFGRPPWAHSGFQGRPGPPGPHGPHDEHHRPGPPHGPPRHHDHHRRGPPADIRDRDRRFGGCPPHRRGPSPPNQDRPDRPPFDISEFLNKLGSKLGIDLTNAAEGLGLVQDRFSAGRTSADVNFEPRADIFENAAAYTIHLSLPGAKKEDVGVEYEGEHSVLRITGVVHRPDVDEQMMGELVVDGRKRETGVFEKAVRLGTKRDPASIDVAGITAKMTDGVLVVRIPKVSQPEQKRGVTISTEPEDQVMSDEQPDYENDYSEKPVLFDAEEQASEFGELETGTTSTKRGEISLIDMKDNDAPVVVPEEKKSKAQEAETEQKKAEASKEEEQLPVYTATAEEDDWERFSDDSGEGEYIKIDVK